MTFALASAPMQTSLSIEVSDWLRANSVVRGAMMRYRLLRDHRPAADNPLESLRSVEQLCAAARLAPTPAAMRAIEQRIEQRLSEVNLRAFDWSVLIPNFSDKRFQKAVLLKPWISQHEKGILLVNYESQYMRLIGLKNLDAFAAEYTLIVGPSWHPPHSLINCAFPRAYPAPFFSLISNSKDAEILPRLSPHYIPLPLYGSSWVNPNRFQPQPWDKRDIDIIMVSNWSKTKRHHALFKALRTMPASLRVLLIGQNQDGRTANHIRAEAKLYGVENRFDLISNAEYPVVVDALCRAKISLVLSRREGSCVAIAESLFADTPAALLADAEIGSRAFINDQTGRLLHDGDLAPQLMEFLAAANKQKFSPRQWADAHISCFQSTRTLNEILQKHALAQNQQWTTDIAPVTWAPNPQLAHPEDNTRLRAGRQRLKEKFEIELGYASK